MAQTGIEPILTLLNNKNKETSQRLAMNNMQRRNLVMNDFDKEYQVTGNATNDGIVYLSISPDLIYASQWGFKVIVESTLVPLKPGSMAIVPATLELDPLVITMNGSTPTINQPNITPNPHTHQVNAGVTLAPSDFTEVEILLDGHNLTSAFKSQHSWIRSTSGMYPDKTLVNNYDILGAISTLDEGARDNIFNGGYHELRFKANGLFSFKIREFKMYNAMNRQGDRQDPDLEDDLTVGPSPTIPSVANSGSNLSLLSGEEVVQYLIERSDKIYQQSLL